MALIMKKLFYLLMAALVIASSTGCNDIRQKLLPAFNVNIPAIQLTIPPIPFVAKEEVPVGALSTYINMDSTIRANTAGTFGADAVSSVRVKKVTVTALNADASNNLSNFEMARMRLYSDNDTTAIDIASIVFPGSFTETFTMENDNAPDISNYLRGSRLAYNLYWKNRASTSKSLKLHIIVTLSIK